MQLVEAHLLQDIMQLVAYLLTCIFGYVHQQLPGPSWPRLRYEGSIQLPARLGVTERLHNMFSLLATRLVYMTCNHAPDCGWLPDLVSCVLPKAMWADLLQAFLSDTNILWTPEHVTC